ncbi:aminoglycoside resistance protein, partial [Klebsiella pneumoniae subsp. pneumoniae KPNIH17]
RMRSRNWSRTLTERSGGNGAVAVFMACYDCFFVQSMPRASKQQARYAVGRCLMLWSSNDVTQQGSRPKTKLDIMRVAVTIEISNQLSEVLSVIERHLESTLLAVHLYGSAVDGGLKPYSDIDLLVTVAVKLDETTRRALLND